MGENVDEHSGEHSAEHIRYDRLGVFLSALCSVHCLLTPVLVAFAPALGHYFNSELVHIILFTLVFPLAIYAFYTSYKEHHSIRPMSFGVFGIFLLAVELVLHEIFDGQMGWAIWASVFGGLFLAYGHYLNIKVCQSCPYHDHHHHHD